MDFETAVGIALGAIMYAYGIFKFMRSEISKAVKDSQKEITLDTQNKISELKATTEKTISDVSQTQAQAHSGEIRRAHERIDRIQESTNEKINALNISYALLEQQSQQITGSMKEIKEELKQVDGKIGNILESINKIYMELKK